MPNDPLRIDPDEEENARKAGALSATFYCAAIKNGMAQDVALKAANAYVHALLFINNPTRGR